MNNGELQTKTQNDAVELNAARPWVKYLVTAGAAMAAVLLVLLSKGGFASDLTGMDRLMAWCDALFIVGMLLVCFGGLIFVSREGAFDGISYAVRSLTWRALPTLRRAGAKRSAAFCTWWPWAAYCWLPRGSSTTFSCPK